MATLTFGSRVFETAIASDLVRNGMSLEAWEILGDKTEQVAEVFYSDVEKSFSFSAFEEGLPLGLIEFMSSEARVRLSPATELTGGNP
ncbi:hypothetical protein [Rhizobium sp. TRM95796]|uniref:hypothetical protein n=1 Tax=Rhizobium sp. TRM95796 TaxID=2979862 RepID=UPI0021E96C9D|nr:hypothetical protein [Rhizobium sp. TRM95796]MCV3767559.1 hypothetical protein [Rhizobium sp. TRM95796]